VQKYINEEPNNSIEDEKSNNMGITLESMTGPSCYIDEIDDFA
jgi:hypothetical protein